MELRKEHHATVQKMEEHLYLICNRALRATREFKIVSEQTDNQKEYLDGLFKISERGRILLKWANGVVAADYVPETVEYGIACSKALLLDEMIQFNHNIAKNHEEFIPMKDLLLFDSVLVLSSQKLVKLLYKRTIEEPK